MDGQPIDGFTHEMPPTGPAFRFEVDGAEVVVTYLPGDSDSPPEWRVEPANPCLEPYGTVYANGEPTEEFARGVAERCLRKQNEWMPLDAALIAQKISAAIEEGEDEAALEALTELVEYAEAQAARAAELESVLRPFAVAGRAQDGWGTDRPDDGPIMTVYRDDECNSKAITLIRKHFREAARLAAT